jgi:hypothetical protein
MKYSQWAGIAAAVLLMISCVLNWTWYPDLHKYFTAFSSEQNIYGQPGRVFIFLAVVAIIFYSVSKLWAKRWNLFVNCIIMAYAIRTFILFTTCYRGICPEKQTGIWLMLASSVMMMIAALLPDMKIKNENLSNK